MAIIKYKDTTTGDYIPVNTKTTDTLPVGSEVDFDGNEVPSGWTEVNNVLYYNASGSNDTITLSDNVNNYDYLEIYYSGNTPSNILTQKVDLKLGNGTILFMFNADNNGSMYFNTRSVSISGTTISTNGTRYGTGQSGSWSNFSHTNNVYIYKVIGYKE